MAEFVGVELPTDRLDRIASLVEAPPAVRRYHVAGSFDELGAQDLDDVRSFGFEI